MMIVIVYAAVASTCIAPFTRRPLRSPEALIRIVVVECIVISWAWAGLTRLIVRKSPLRDWVISVLLAIGFVSPLMLFIADLVWLGIIQSTSMRIATLFAAVVTALICGLVLRGVVLCRCPSCCRRSLLRDISDAAEAAVTPRGRHFLPAYRCLRCDGLFLWVNRAWRSAGNPLPDHPPISHDRAAGPSGGSRPRRSSR